MREGIHLYVNLKNLDSIVEDAQKHGDIRKVFYSVDLYFEGLESWVKNCCPKSVHIEKLTGSRIHFVFEASESSRIAPFFWDAVDYAQCLLMELNKSSKLDSLNADYELNMGADFGSFVRSPINHKGITEDNSIGNPANRAAKIQALAPAGYLWISSDLKFFLEPSLPKSISILMDPRSPLMLKYGIDSLYQIGLADVAAFLRDQGTLLAQRSNPFERFQDNLTETNLSKYSPVPIDSSFVFGKSTRNPKHIKSGYVLYCDIRGSTKLVADSANKDMLPALVKGIMDHIYQMVDAVLDNGLSHVQVQGDRESAMLVVGNAITAARSILACAFAMLGVSFQRFFEGLNISAEKFPLSVGVGIAYGSFYRSSVGASFQPDNLLLGTVVNWADEAEDEGAKTPNSIALTPAAFKTLTSVGDPTLTSVVKKAFEPTPDNRFYVSKVTMQGYRRLVAEAQQERNAASAASNGDRPWAAPHADNTDA